MAAGGTSPTFRSAPREIEINATQPLIRIHRLGKSPVFFGPSSGTPAQNRFDAPKGEYRILYAAAQLEGAFVETILRTPLGRVLRRAYVEERAWSSIILLVPVRLARLFDEGLQALGIDAGTISVDDYEASRILALSLYQQFPDLDGLAYRSRYDNGQICSIACGNRTYQ